IIENMVRQSPRTISFTVHLVEAPDTLLLPRNQNADRSDATPHLSRLFDESAKPDSPVRILHTAFLETPSGQRAMLETVADHEYTKKLAVDAQGRTAVEDRVRKLGFRLEVDPVIEADGFTAQLKLLVQTVALPEQPPGPSPQFETGKVETELSIAGGRTRFAGAWPVAEGISHAVFFTAHIIPEQMTRSMTSTLTALPKDPLAMMEHTFVLPESLREIEPNTKHEIFTDIPVLKGIDLPPGSKAGIDKVGHLHVRTTAEMMTVVDAAVQHHLDVFPKSLAFSLEVFRASAATLRPMIIESAGHGNHSAALQKLKAAVIAGTATQEILSHIETRGGRAKLQSHLDRHLLTELTWLADHPPSLSTLHRPSGIGFEIDASIDPGSHSVPFAFVLDRHFTQPKPCFEPLGRIAIPRHDFPHARIQCSSRLIDGHTKLVAVWRPVNNSGELADDVLEAVFITSRVVRHIPDEAKQPTPWQTAEPKVTPAVGKGLHQRTFKVPKDFLTAGTVPPSEDPFAISASADIRDDRDLFTKSGISSPDGSSAIFNPTTGVLIVVNTDENLTLIESLVKQIWRQTPKISSFNLHLIEAPASIVSDLLTTSIGNADHTFALRQLFNQAASEKARVRTTLKVSAANGPATIEQVREEPFLKEIKVADHGTPETAHGVKRVGTALKLHPTLAPDGLTIDLTCSLTHHPAPPVPHT
ncbi:MAG TPA: hypothetical protein VD994_14645, partial [Prosthecobacter sp.]|nr:hypothetical protein [Prosthecobacter sp.]